VRSGFVSIIGRPNAGKSTLLNALTGEKVAIVTSKPQTTRTRIQGVVEVEAVKGKHPAAQIVFVDTPGVHKPSSQLDKQMMHEVHEALEQRDAVILMIDATREQRLPDAEATATTNESPNEQKARRFSATTSEDEMVLEMIRHLDCPVLLVINKIDLIKREDLLPLITQFSALHKFAAVIPLSARKKDGLDRLVEAIVAQLPNGERYFPQDQFTDQPERFLVAELIRERILMETGEEVPYASAVVIEKYEEPPHDARPRKDGKLPVTKISAAIYCERDGQKAILIGKGGSKLKSIGASARKEIESLLGTRVFLELYIIVEENWRDSKGFISNLDWRKQLDDIAAHGESRGAPEKLESLGKPKQ
jgi:GTP-binding protein Era